jgi:hypothetical protein
MDRQVEPSAESFFSRSLALIVGIALIVLLAGQTAGLAYRPRPLGPSRREVLASDRFVAVFGGSRVEAGIDPSLLSEELSAHGQNVKAAVYAGGGWDMLHSYMLALLSRDILRPNRDAVVVDVSAWSVNDTWEANRLGAIRPSVALEVAALPGEPLEARLDVLLGAVSGLYRYRVSLQATIGTKLTAGAERLGGLLRRAGLVRNGAAPAFTLITEPGKNFVIQEIKGDLKAFHELDRHRQDVSIDALKTGGFKLRALERTVAVLRERGITVYLVQIPTSKWFYDRLARVPGAAAYRDSIPDIAERSQAKLLADWPEPFYRSDRFWDEMHMTPSACQSFTRALAESLRTDVEQ